jgi:hypothetical protein
VIGEVDGSHHVKLTGTGVDGSHSAVFGLTPDGHKHEETNSTTTAPKPAFSKEDAMGGRKSVAATGDGGLTGGGRDQGVAGQMNAPDQGPKGLERTDPVPTAQDEGSSAKPGAGMTGMSQGSGGSNFR